MKFINGIMSLLFLERAQISVVFQRFYLLRWDDRSYVLYTKLCSTLAQLSVGCPCQMGLESIYTGLLGELPQIMYVKAVTKL